MLQLVCWKEAGLDDGYLCIMNTANVNEKIVKLISVFLRNLSMRGMMNSFEKRVRQLRSEGRKEVKVGSEGNPSYSSFYDSKLRFLISRSCLSTPNRCMSLFPFCSSHSPSKHLLILWCHDVLVAVMTAVRRTRLFTLQLVFDLVHHLLHAFHERRRR